MSAMSRESPVDAGGTQGVRCQLCLANWSTRHVTQNSPAGRSEDLYYCETCYEAKYLKIGTPAGGFPRPRYTLKNAAIVIAVCRACQRSSGLRHAKCSYRGLGASAPQNVHAYVGVNLSVGFYTACFLLSCWLGRVIWYKRTGGLVRPPELRTRTRNDQARFYSEACHALCGAESRACSQK